MARIHLADLWPGVARLWLGGQPIGLVVASAFTLLLNGAVLTSLHWTAFAPTNVRWVLPLVVVVFWLLGGLESIRFRLILRKSAGQETQVDLFLRARAEYLRGDWESSERHLDEILSSHPQDIEARLSKATLLRHQDRHSEAREQLRRLQRWQASAGWRMEIRREWEQLAKREFSRANITNGRGVDKVSGTDLSGAA